MLKNTDELKNRVEARKHELMAKYNQAKADTRKEAATTRDHLKARLDEIEGALKDGWENLSESVAAKINSWLEKRD
jgi:hypothetical protein